MTPCEHHHVFTLAGSSSPRDQRTMAAGLCPNHANAAADGEAGGRVWQGLLLRVNVRAFGVMQNLITIVRVIYAMATAL